MENKTVFISGYKEKAIKLNSGYAQLKRICLREKLQRVLKLTKKGV